MASKSPCPKCGEMTTDIAHLRSRHVDNCDGTLEQKEPEMSPVEAPVEVKEAPKKSSPANYANDEIKNLVELAQAKEREYEQAPDAFVNADSVDDHMELRKIYAPETLDVMEGGKVVKTAERSAFVADKNQLKLAAQRGYVPKLDGSGELVRTAHGDVLCTIPAERSRAQQAAAAKASHDRLRKSEKSVASKSTIKGETVDASGIRVEQATRTKL